MKSSKFNWFKAKENWKEALAERYDKKEASNILLILAEETLKHHNPLAFRDAFLELEQDEVSRLEKGVNRLKTGEPLQYVIGKAWFYDIDLLVNEHVLIPRPETEELVSWIIEGNAKEVSILDIGTGSGCIPLTLKKHLPMASLTAVDLDPNAIELAKKNGKELGLEVEFKVCDILNTEASADLGEFDIIVSNPPYIPSSEKTLMKENVLAYEPHLALFVENEDALIFYREIAKFALKHLNVEGQLFYECNEYNAKEVMHLLEAMSFQNIELKQDLQGKDRMIKCTF